ncbi:hypothetical protein NDA13_001397 [Ustilago tritici]|nr:hypothetical protein NDA13_001397 [Ustilago tritici]
MSATSPHHVTILGCGVIGLSTALAILEGQQENPRDRRTLVTIVSKEVPDLGHGTQHSAVYASVWAGGHHVSDAKSERELRHDKITFERMSNLSRERPWARPASSSQTCNPKPVPPITDKSSGFSSHGSQREPEPLVWVHQTELFETASSSQAFPRSPYEGVLAWYPDFKPLPSSSLTDGIGHGCTFSTIDINVPVYHRWLLRRVIDLGGRLIVAEAKSLRQAVSIASSSTATTMLCKNPSQWRNVGKVGVLVASPGLGARTIGGLEDKAVHPQRGQVVVVNAPWLSTSTSLSSYAQKPRHKIPGFSVIRPQGGREVYVIPRGDGTVVCGGTRIVDDWDPKPRPETTKRILERCIALVPQLVDPKKTTGLTKPRVEDIDVVGVNVGLRPARRDGARLERALQDIDEVKVIYNYGYGGAGYQASWGAALDAKQLVEEALGKGDSRSSTLVRPSKL